MERLEVAGIGGTVQLGIGDYFDNNNYINLSSIPELNNLKSVPSAQHYTLVLRENQGENRTELSW